VLVWCIQDGLGITSYDGKLADGGAKKATGKVSQLNSLIRKLRVHASISSGTICSLHLGHKDRYFLAANHPRPALGSPGLG
jgi:hypothetical protein